MSTSTIKPLKILLVVVGGIGKVAPIIQYSYHHFARVHDPARYKINGTGLVLGMGEKPFMTETFSSPPGRYTILAEQFIREADGILLAYSVTSKYAFRLIEAQYAKIERLRSGGDPRKTYCRGRRVAPMPLLLVGIESRPNGQRMISTKEGADLARKLGMEFMEVAETWDSPVETLFYDIVRTIDTHTQQIGDSSESPQSPEDTASQSLGETLNCWMRLVSSKMQLAIRNCKRETPTGIDRLCNAISADEKEAVRRLIRGGVNVNAVDQNGSTPLHVAVVQNRIEIVKLLLQNGAFVDQVSPLNGTALSVAASRGNDEIVQILLGHGAGVDIPCDYYGNMLQATARRDNPSILRHLDKRISWHSCRN